MKTESKQEKIIYGIRNSFSFPIALIIVGVVIAFIVIYIVGKESGSELILTKNVSQNKQEAFKICIESGRYADHVEADVQDAISAGGRGTPYNIIINQNKEFFVINGELPYEQMKQNIDQILHGSLSANPDTQNISLRPISDADHILGDRNAQIKIIEFSDIECPFCKRFHITMQKVVQEYDGQVAWVYRHFPLDTLHKKARKEAEAVECAGELGGNEMFWKYLNRLFEVTPSNDRLNYEELYIIATYIGL